MYCKKKTTKKQRKKSTVLSGLQSDQVLHLVLILPVVTNDFSISGVEIDDLKLFEVTCYLNFVWVIKNWSTFFTCLVQTFQKSLCWQFVVPCTKHLVGSETLSCNTWNISTLSILAYYKTNSLLLSGFKSLPYSSLFSSLKVLSVFADVSKLFRLEVSLFHVAP